MMRIAIRFRQSELTSVVGFILRRNYVQIRIIVGYSKLHHAMKCHKTTNNVKTKRCETPSIGLHSPVSIHIAYEFDSC